MTLRPARYEDAVLFYAFWADPEARRYSPSATETPDWQRHLDWFLAQSHSLLSTLLVAEEDGEPIGTLRLNDLDRRSWISIIVARRDRGIGYGGKILATLHTKQRGPLWAKIHRDHAVSQRLFEHAGYVRHTTEGDYHTYCWVSPP